MIIKSPRKYSLIFSQLPKSEKFFKHRCRNKAFLTILNPSSISSTMDSFLDQLTKTVEQSILSTLSSKLNEFAAHVADLPEMKEQAVTKEQILECWNSVSDFKVPVSASRVATISDSPASKKPRAQTDKLRKCQVPKMRGDSKGEPCGKNCVLDCDFCPEHLKKNQKSPDANSPAADVSSKSTVQAVKSEAPAAGAMCEHLLQTGANKGNPCGKKVSSGSWCSVHAKKH
jgi:hypothetical protein